MSFYPEAPPRFWAACFLVLALLVHAGIRWIPAREAPPPELRPIVLDLPVIPVTFAQAGPLDLNRATAEELQGLPGIGPVLAARILSWRETHGPFTSVEDLLAVPGIGPRTLENLRAQVTVTPP